MRYLTSRLAVLLSAWILCIVSPCILAQQPPDPVSSDSSGNTAMGLDALLQQSGGTENTAGGYVALYSNTSGGYNTAFGAYALFASTTSSGNSGFGQAALTRNTTGARNTAVGSNALFSNTTANDNTAVGYLAMQSTTTGGNNTASGYYSLLNNTTGANNTAFGMEALSSNTAGTGNAAQGFLALFSNTTGNRNLAIGNNALGRNSTGSYNIGLGFQGGLNLTTGTDNIDIAHVGVAGESQTLRLGTDGTAGVPGSGIVSAYIAGIATTTVTGSAVYVTSSGQLGVLASSDRYKTDIAPLGTRTENLQQLRPVSFRLKSDPSGTVQYGLIAEEVAKVFPELVIRGADGRINGVRYEELTPMLLNELQNQAAEIRDLKQQRKQFVEQAAQLRDVQRQLTDLHAALVKLQSRAELVAQR